MPCYTLYMSYIVL